MTVIAFVGKPRTGKTLGMTQLAYTNYRNGHEILANYKLNFPSKSMTVSQMLQIPFDDVDRHPKTLCIQEADKIFDSRRSMKEENRLLSGLTGQSGKRNLNILYDTQFFTRIDSSLRYVTEYVVSCSCFIDDRTKEPIAFQYTYEDMYDGRIRKALIPANLLQPFYSMYDTYEATKSLSRKSEIDIDEHIKEELKKDVEPKKKKNKKEYARY